MEKWADENIGKMFINRIGIKAKFISRSDEPSVTLEFDSGNRDGFGIGSLNDRGWKLYKEEVIKGANIEPSNEMHFYCRKCDVAPIDVEKDKDGFYICKECKSFASVVDKDEQEKEDDRVKLKERSERDKIRYVIDKYMDNELDLNEAILQLKTINSLEKNKEDNWNLRDKFIIPLKEDDSIPIKLGDKLYHERDIKTFIQKTKGKIDKGMNPIKALNETAGDL